jgi:hypothetical protein
MKNKQKNWNVNNQEDEDGFSLNPYDIFIYDSTNGNKEFGTNRNTTTSESGYAKLTMISSKEKRCTNKVPPFPNHVTIINKKQLIAT